MSKKLVYVKEKKGLVEIVIVIIDPLVLEFSKIEQY